MKRVRRVLVLVLPLLLATPVATVTACGGSTKEADNPKLKSHDMPEGAEWTGVYYSQLFGNLHMVAEGDSVTGRWRTAAGEKWGEMHGKFQGDVLQYEWVQHTIGMVGPSATTKGKGFFRYERPKGEHVEDQIHGEWGLSDAVFGNKWDAIKQTNQTPDLESVKPDETQGTNVHSWDDGESSGSESGGEEKKGDDKGGGGWE